MTQVRIYFKTNKIHFYYNQYKIRSDIFNELLPDLENKLDLD